MNDVSNSVSLLSHRDLSKRTSTILSNGKALHCRNALCVIITCTSSIVIIRLYLSNLGAD